MNESDLIKLLMEQVNKLSDKCKSYRDTIAQQGNAITQRIGDNYPSRPIVEYALKTQEGSSINLRKARKEFLKALRTG